jgi:hypothetical protein
LGGITISAVSFFARIPFMRKLNWKVLVVKGFMEQFRTKIEPSMHLVLVYSAPEMYWGTAQGIGNIFRYCIIDFAWRGKYLNT